MESAQRSALAGCRDIHNGARTAVSAQLGSRSTQVLTLSPLTAFPVPLGHDIANALAAYVPVDGVNGSCGCRWKARWSAKAQARNFCRRKLTIAVGEVRLSTRRMPGQYVAGGWLMLQSMMLLTLTYNNPGCIAYPGLMSVHAACRRIARAGKHARADRDNGGTHDGSAARDVSGLYRAEKLRRAARIVAGGSGVGRVGCQRQHVQRTNHTWAE